MGFKKNTSKGKEDKGNDFKVVGEEIGGGAERVVRRGIRVGDHFQYGVKFSKK